MSRLVSAWRLMERLTKPVIWLAVVIMLATDFIWDLAWWGKLFSLIFWVECGFLAWIKNGRQAELRRPVFYIFAGLLAMVLTVHYYRQVGWLIVLAWLVMDRLNRWEAEKEKAGHDAP